MENMCSKVGNVQLLGNMVLGVLKIRKVSWSGPEVLQNFFQECNQHWHPTLPTG